MMDTYGYLRIPAYFSTDVTPNHQSIELLLRWKITSSPNQWFSGSMSDLYSH